MSQIVAAAEEMKTVVKRIEDIAFQTNMLALNAHVEAARAGEAGKGFTVVAGEVRSIAESATGATHKIKGLIDVSITRIDEGVGLVGKAEAAFEKIAGSVETVSGSVGTIARDAETQSGSTEEIRQAITELDGATQQNAILANESTTLSVTLRNQASQLDDQIAKFQLNSAPTRPAAPETDAA